MNGNALRDIYAAWLRAALARAKSAGSAGGKMTTVDLAKRAGISRATVSAILNRRTDADMATIGAIARSLNIPPPSLEATSAMTFEPLPAHAGGVEETFEAALGDLAGWVAVHPSLKPAAARAIHLLGLLHAAAGREAAATARDRADVERALKVEIQALREELRAARDRPPRRAGGSG